MVYRAVLIFFGLLFIGMLVTRSVLVKTPNIVLTDDRDYHERWLQIRLKLPPSGYKPGHLIRDTLKNDKLQTPPYMDIGRFAYRQFLSSPKDQRARVLRSLESMIGPYDAWVDRLAAADVELLCIGETHQDNYRRFLAERFFTQYPLDILFLEARGVETHVMRFRAGMGEDYVDLLYADIADIIRAARTRNPNVTIIGIEESRGQESERRRLGWGSRDRSLYENIVAHFRPGRRGAVLVGALHCDQRMNWLYTRLRAPRSPLRDSRLLSMRLMSERKDLLSREFTRFLGYVGYRHADYVIEDTAVLDPLIHAWFLDLSENLQRYHTVVLFGAS